MSRERQGRIKYWEEIVRSSGKYFGPIQQEIVQETIKDLKELDEIKEKEGK